MSHLLLSPLTWGLLLVAALCLGWRRLGRNLRIAGLACGACVLLLSTPLGANALVRLVESSLPAGSTCGIDAREWPVVVLSGGFARAPRAVDDYAALQPASWRRLHGAIRFWRDSQGRGLRRLVIAGGGFDAIRESVVLARLARDWGVPAAQIQVETGSTTTWESAMALRGQVPPRIRLVSSAMHLPRALLAFRSAGFKPCVHASDSLYVMPGSWGYFVPQLSAMAKTRTALYELAGMAAYRVRAYRNRDTPGTGG